MEEGVCVFMTGVLRKDEQIDTKILILLILMVQFVN